MADYSNKFVDATGVKHLWNKAEDTFIKKNGTQTLSDENFTTADKEKLDSLVNYELPVASADTAGGVKIGSGLTVDENGVVSTVYNPEMDVAWDSIADLPNTLAGYGITDAATKDELEAVKTQVSKVYKYKGQVETEADLADIENPENGDTYDVKDAGSNFAWNEDEARWDNLGGITKIDSLSNLDLDIITGSASSPEALAMLFQEGGNIDLTTDVALNENIIITKDTVLDLSEHELSVNVTGYALTAQGAKLTIKNGDLVTTKRIAQATNGGEIVIESGNYESGDVAFTCSGENSKITFENGTVVCVEGGIGAFDGGEIEINGGTITGKDNFPVFTNGTAGRGGNTIVLNGGTLIGQITSNGYESCGVYIANNDTFIMNGGEIISENGCGLLMRAGNVTINGGSIAANGEGSGWVGDNKTKMSHSAVIYHESANYPGKDGMSLVINDGTFVGGLEVLSNEATPNVTVNGGTFIDQ